MKVLENYQMKQNNPNCRLQDPSEINVDNLNNGRTEPADIS
jgi:hypothetical protein